MGGVGFGDRHQLLALLVAVQLYHPGPKRVEAAGSLLLSKIQ